MVKSKKDTISYSYWIINVLENSCKKHKLSDVEKEWLLKNSSKLIICEKECILKTEKELIVDVNEKDTLYVQDKKVYEYKEYINKKKTAFVLLPLNEKKDFYIIFWYVPEKNS